MEVGPRRSSARSGFELTKAWFAEEGLLAAARCVWAAERALHLAADWASRRVEFGRPIADHQLVQGMLADSAVDLVLMRNLVYQVAWKADRGASPALLHGKTAMAKLVASEAAGRVIDRAVQVFGGRGCERDRPVEQLYREIRRERILNGPSEILRLIVGAPHPEAGLDALLRPPGPAG